MSETTEDETTEQQSTINLHERLDHVVVGAEAINQLLQGNQSAEEIKRSLDLTDEELREVRETLNALYDHYA